MKRFLFCLTVYGLLAGDLFGQVRTVKPIEAPKKHPTSTLLSFGLGGAGSVLFLSRNVKADNEAYGYQLSMVYGGAKLMRGSVEYTHYQTIDIEPTWYQVKASTIECNMHILARFNETNAIFYPLFGISYNMFSGFYTGVNDYLNLSELYGTNTQVNTSWLGLNIGTGYECYFNRFSFYADYKMRIGISEGYNELTIMDVCLSAGIRYSFKVPTLNKLFRGTRSRYSLKVD